MIRKKYGTHWRKQNDKSNISEVVRSGNDVIRFLKLFRICSANIFSKIGPKFAERIPIPEKSQETFH